MVPETAYPLCDGSTPRMIYGMIDFRSFDRSHLDGVIRLCAAEGWPSFPADPERTVRVLTAPGVTTVVATEAGTVLGFAQLFSDGELQAFLALLTVDRERRGEGIGRSLVTEALRRAGGARIDLLSEPDSLGFYRSFPHVESPGIRLYPNRSARDGITD